MATVILSPAAWATTASPRLPRITRPALGAVSWAPLAPREPEGRLPRPCLHRLGAHAPLRAPLMRTPRPLGAVRPKALQAGALPPASPLCAICTLSMLDLLRAAGCSGNKNTAGSV